MRDVARRAFAIGVWAVVADVLVQVLLAGLGLLTDSGFLFWHANINGAIVFFLPMLLILVGWYARVPVRIRLLTAAVPALVVLQSILLIPYHLGATGPLRAISALHVLNALLIFWVAIQLVERTRDVPRSIAQT